MLCMADSLPHPVNHRNNFFPHAVWRHSYIEVKPEPVVEKAKPVCRTELKGNVPTEVCS